MFFFLSKTLSYLTMPIVVICTCFLVAVFLKRELWRKRLRAAGVFLLFLFSNDFIGNEVMLLWEVPPTPFAELKKKYSYGIVLTGVGKSEMEPADRMYFGRGADRVTHTLQLYKLGFIQKVLVSGGNGKLYDVKKQEADEMADVLILMGVPKEDIVIENTSRNTRESALAVTKMLGDNVKPEDCILITSAFHIRRSKACFAKLGWNVDEFSTDFFSHKRRYTPDVLFIPSAGTLSNWHILTREWTGMITYKLMGYA
jgi:uncharacterized SAM-binding protein YcdF (DUF218 family)